MARDWKWQAKRRALARPHKWAAGKRPGLAAYRRHQLISDERPPVRVSIDGVDVTRFVRRVSII